MPKLNIVGGDFKSSVGHVSKRFFSLPSNGERAICDSLKMDQVNFIDLATSELGDFLGIKESKRIPEISLNIPTNEVLFCVKFEDDRTLLASAKKDTYNSIQNDFMELAIEEANHMQTEQVA